VPVAHITAFPAQVLIVVPSRSFPNAPDRNLLRRRTRELYRLRKQKLYDTLSPAGSRIALLIFYSGREIAPYPGMESAFEAAFAKLIYELKKDPPLTVAGSHQAV
jgi:ribonuclease P protein component